MDDGVAIRVHVAMVNHIGAALRKWATQFYDVPPSGDVTVSA